MQELWSSVVLKNESYATAEKIQPQIELALTLLYEEQITLQTLIQSMPTDNELTQQSNIVRNLTEELARYANDRDKLSEEILRINEEMSSMNSLENESWMLYVVPTLKTAQRFIKKL